MSICLNTDSVRKGDRFGYWREAVCDAYVQLDCSSTLNNRFQGQILLNRLSKLSVSFVSGSNQFVRRRKSDISRNVEASFLISMQLDKQGVVEQGGRQAQISPGDFALYSSIEEYSLSLPDDFQQMVVQIPRDEMLARLPNADLLTGMRVGGESMFGTLIYDSVRQLVSSIDQSNKVVQQYVQDTVVDLFVTGLASLKESSFELSRPEQQVFARAVAFLRENLSDPELDREMLANAMGMSVRRLSELFQVQGTSIASSIREMRLKAIASNLKDVRFSRQSISEIAANWGLFNQQNLVRNFRDQFGVTPRAYRNGTSLLDSN